MTSKTEERFTLIERLARVISGGKSDKTRDREWRVDAREVLKALNLSESAAASLAEGRGVVVPVEDLEAMQTPDIQNAVSMVINPEDPFQRPRDGEDPGAWIERCSRVAASQKESET